VRPAGAAMTGLFLIIQGLHTPLWKMCLFVGVLVLVLIVPLLWVLASTSKEDKGSEDLGEAGVQPTRDNDRDLPRTSTGSQHHRNGPSGGGDSRSEDLDPNRHLELVMSSIRRSKRRDRSGDSP
jgi:hypothetical protein